MYHENHMLENASRIPHAPANVAIVQSPPVFDYLQTANAQ